MTTPARITKSIPLVAGIFAAGYLAHPQQDPATSICSTPRWNGFEFDPGKYVRTMAIGDMRGIQSAA